ncbi:hypothetical protein TVAG_426210 [Trichomonas vaginalis G3]|uniref:Uncharacterized protein n=1 Tax=Trichomonas vaginalis (strain ATCC PRA-98 / G3) TaxID=412133 RepID=A2DYN8_TRIV3|nr:hypothetical protein TVAGG3_0850750 [Trichomonas vaginalis G3]EAY14428.1 hypothetical protein TVAG_426210 [Trichomonas vaginalis G3]KAI5499966.1 hypothetical protein TVAGG3_0850750 [Trichomonas vaginalis G3]|eukprot:XP_001326651.1 hypothetical protein [Trichomonas vaginalis G3]
MTLQSALEQIEEQLEINERIEKEIAQKRIEFAEEKAKISLTEMNFDDSEIFNQLDAEYKDLYNELSNKTKSLESEYRNHEEEINKIVESLKFLYDNQSKINIDYSRSITDSKLSKCSNERDEKYAKLLEDQISDLDVIIRQVKSQIKQTDKELGHQTEISNLIQERGGGALETVNEIKSLESDVRKITNSLDDGNNEIMNIQEIMANDEDEYAAQMEKIESLYGYQKIHSAMRGILQQYNQSISENQEFLMKLDRNISNSENRYKVLSKLPKNNNLPNEEIEMETDQLIKNLKLLQKRESNRIKYSKAEMEELTELIQKSEKKVEQLKYSLSIAQQLLKAENRDMKNVVSKQKESNFDRETETLASIIDYRLKTPQRASPKKSLIPRRTPK